MCDAAAVAMFETLNELPEVGLRRRLVEVVLVS